jgi:nucleoside-diphosphate-sugar epimerase
MNILITGGLGHIGSYLITNLKKIKDISQVYVIDNNSNNKINSIFNLKGKKLNLIIDDLCNKDCFKKIKHKIDIIVHLASMTDAESSVKKKKLFYNNNLNSFKNIIEFSKKKNSKLIHISSTSVYGSQAATVDETCAELKPQSPYAHVKILEEKLIKKLKKKNYITLRFGTIVGYSIGMRFHTAVNKFCLHALLNKPLTVWETAMDQYRPYLSVRDAFATLKYIIENNYFDNQIHNVCSNNYTVRQILTLIKEFKKEITIKLTSSKIMNQLSYKVVSQNKLMKRVSLKKEIKSEIKYIFSALKIVN